jgi:hypothetical protein
MRTPTLLTELNKPLTSSTWIKREKKIPTTGTAGLARKSGNKNAADFTKVDRGLPVQMSERKKFVKLANYEDAVLGIHTPRETAFH